MKRLIGTVILTFICTLPFYAQIKGVIKGVTSPDTKFVYLYSEDEQGKVDSVPVKKGDFILHYTANEPYMAYLSARKGKVGAFLMYCDGSNATVDFPKKEFRGSELNNKLQELNRDFEKISEEAVLLNAEIKSYMRDRSKLSDSERADLEKKIESFSTHFRAFICHMANENKDNMIPSFLLRGAEKYLTKEELIELTTSDRVYMKSPHMNKMREMAENYKRTAVGVSFTDIQLTDTLGKTHKLSDYLGKGNYVLVDFWASWCGPCRAEMPHVKAAYEKYASKGFEIVGLSLDNKADAWKKSIQTMGLKWPQFSDLKGWQSEVAILYGIRSIPATILFGPDGKIVGTSLRGEALMHKLAEIYP